MSRFTDEMKSLMPPAAAAAADAAAVTPRDAVAAAPPSGSSAVSDLTELLSKRLLLDVVMKLPVIVMPLSSTSTSALVIDLGGLSVANELRVVPDVVSVDNFPAVIDWTNFGLKNINVTRSVVVVVVNA